MTENKINEQALDELLKDCKDPQQFEAVFQQLKKAIVERALAGELTHHLGYAHGEKKPAGQTNQRNGSSAKKVLSDTGAVAVEVPRDRAGSFEPQLLPKHQRRLPAFDDKVLSLYARGMTVRQIQGHLQELYGVEVSPELISRVTDAVLEEVNEWQARPLEGFYPVLVFDALRVKIRDEGVVKNKAVYLALGITREGFKEILGIWIETNEGAKFWQRVMSELANRGVRDVLVCLVDGLKGFPEAIEAVFPHAQVQTCIVHLLRDSLSYCGWQDRKRVARELKAIYSAPSAQAAEQALGRFTESADGQKYPMIGANWRRHWEQVIPFFAYPPAVRRVLYTTNAIESVHMRLRKVTRNRGHFPSDAAAMKLLYLALRNITAKWKAAAIQWRAAMLQFALLYPERFGAAP